MTSGTFSVASIVLAAGKGTRMKSQHSKMVHQVAGKPMVYWPVNLALQLKASPVSVVLGYDREAVQASLEKSLGNQAADLRFTTQEQQLGTADAVRTGLMALEDYTGDYVLILIGDAPLLTPASVKKMLTLAKRKDPGVLVLTAMMEDPTGYGRVVRTMEGKLEEVEQIVEEKDADEDQKDIAEVNSSIYLIKTDLLRGAINRIERNNAQHEFYLTDIVKIARASGHTALPVELDDAEEIMGVNDRVQLAEAEYLLRMRINRQHALNGVTILDPTTTFISADTKIKPDTILHAGVELRGASSIGAGVVVETGSIITDSTLGDDIHVKPYSVISGSVVHQKVEIGPFAHIRPGSEIMCEARVGNFVETKKTTLGAGAKASHLSYLGDARIGAEVNIGAGTITCNYDGVHKHETVIEDGAFIGSDTQLVAPVKVGRNATVGAGTTVYQDVPEGALALTRSQQINKENYYKLKVVPRFEAAKVAPKGHAACAKGKKD